ncbi:MAG: PHP domain-containing protein [Lachnospiraceae bacterium]|nr:PHP domain-containing protein [Lachnospiraceae bacterium]
MLKKNDKYPYKYEVHMHTCESSACSRTHAADYIHTFKELGYDGMIITDHFFHGNTAVDRSLPWEDFVEEFCKGYELAKEEGDKQGVKVFFGWEANRLVDEYLIYGLDKAWLKKHPEVKDCPHDELFKIVDEAGGLVVGAHPFRERPYIQKVKLHPLQCHAMEVCNFGNPVYQDAFAYNFCKDRNITMTSGTDLHEAKNLAPSIAGMLFEEPLNDIKDYVERIKSGKGFIPLIPEERKIITPEMKNMLPMFLYDERNIGRQVELEDLGLK